MKANRSRYLQSEFGFGGSAGTVPLPSKEEVAAAPNGLAPSAEREQEPSDAEAVKPRPKGTLAEKLQLLAELKTELQALRQLLEPKQ